MQATRLDELLATRPSLRPGEVVTMVAAIAGELSAIHATGRVHGSVRADGIVVDGTGRPRLRHPGVETPGTEAPSVGTGGADAEADVRALASLAMQRLGPYPPQQLVWTLQEAAEGGVSAKALVAKAVASCRPEPIRRVGQQPAGAATAGVADARRVTTPRRVPRPRRRWPSWRLPDHLAGRWRPLAVVGSVLCLVLVAAAVWANAASTSTEADGTSRPTATEHGRSAATTGPSPSTSPTASRQAELTRWAGVLDRLDRRRAAAYGAGDLDALRRVYVPGCAAFDADAATLRAYERAGLRVRGLRLRVSVIREVSVSAKRARLRIADRLLPYRVVDGGGQVRRERGRDTVTWFLTLRRAAGEWRIAAVRRA